MTAMQEATGLVDVQAFVERREQMARQKEAALDFTRWADAQQATKRRWKPKTCPDCSARLTGEHVCDNTPYVAKRGVCPVCWLELNADGECGACY